MREKPRIRIKAGEPPQTTLFRYKQLTGLLRERKRDLLLMLILLSSSILAFVQAAQENQIPEFSTLPQYLINIEKVTCESIYTYTSNYKSRLSYTYHNLSIESYGNQFLAVDLDANVCKRMAKQLSAGMDVLITHYKGLVFQLQQDKILLLRYRQLLPGIEDEFYFKSLPLQGYGFGILLLLVALWMYIPAFRSD